MIEFIELEKEFCNMVKNDRRETNIISHFMPNPHICNKPKFCLIAMEPSLVWMSKELQNHIESDKITEEERFKRMNFLFSMEDFILHYCSFKYLCDEKFDYYITDISKGAMKTKDASKNRTKRYDRWLALLKEEICILGNPKLISIGKKPYEYLNRHRFKLSFQVMHYSSQNSWRFIRDFEISKKNNELGDIQNKLISFSEKLLTHLKFPPDIISDKLNVLRKTDLSDWKKGLYLNYKEKFENIKKIFDIYYKN